MFWFAARLGRANICALVRGNVEMSSDFAGVGYTDIDERHAWKTELLKEPAAALRFAKERPHSAIAFLARRSHPGRLSGQLLRGREAPQHGVERGRARSGCPSCVKTKKGPCQAKRGRVPGRAGDKRLVGRLINQRARKHPGSRRRSRRGVATASGNYGRKTLIHGF